jgi:hypothetical protein
VCTKTTPCKTGLGCISDAAGTKYTCQKMLAGAPGLKFRADNIYSPSFAISQLSFCNTYNSFDTGAGLLECRPGDQSVDKTEDALKRTDPATTCKYVTYNDLTATATTGVNKESTATCGFNGDTNYYCEKRTGDSYFQNSYAKMTKLDLTSYTCHVNSDWRSCLSFVAPNKDLLQEVAKRQYEVSPRGYAKVANNDKCVKSSITLGYWLTVDSSFGYSVVSTLAAVLAIVSMISLF